MGEKHLFSYLCSEVSNKHGVFLILFEKKNSNLHALLEPPRLLIFEKPATNTVFYAINIKKIPNMPY